MKKLKLEQIILCSFTITCLAFNINIHAKNVCEGSWKMDKKIIIQLGLYRIGMDV